MSSAEFTPGTKHGKPSLVATIKDSYNIDGERVEITVIDSSVFVHLIDDDKPDLGFDNLRAWSVDEVDALIDTLVAAKGLSRALAVGAGEAVDA